MSLDPPPQTPLGRPQDVRPDVDGDLLARLYAGDRCALEALYSGHSAYVMAVALRILRNREEAEEVVQDVFWQLWKGRVRYDARRGRFGTWLFAIARNRALDKLRSRRGPSDSDPDHVLEQLAGSEDPELDTYSRERQARILGALGELSEEQRSAIELAFYGGLSHSEIAEHIGEPLGTVKSRIKRGMGRLREILAGEQVAV